MESLKNVLVGGLYRLLFECINHALAVNYSLDAKSEIFVATGLHKRVIISVFHLYWRADLRPVPKLMCNMTLCKR